MATDSPVLETTPQLGPTKETTPMGRITRRQAAQEAQEAGQCGSPDIFIDKQVRSAMSQKLRDLDYAALFAGRYTGGRYADGSYIRTPRSNRSKVGADQNIYLAEEALLKASKEITATPEVRSTYILVVNSNKTIPTDIWKHYEIQRSLLGLPRPENI